MRFKMFKCMLIIVCIFYVFMIFIAMEIFESVFPIIIKYNKSALTKHNFYNKSDNAECTHCFDCI